MAKMEVREVKLSDLKPSPYNPREISEDALTGLSKSIVEFGLVEPIVWNKRTGHVVGGHQRLKALLRQCVQSTDVVVVDLPKTKEKALNVVLNNRHIQGDWNIGIVNILQELRVEVPELTNTLRLDALQVDVSALFPAPDLSTPTGANPQPEHAACDRVVELGCSNKQLEQIRPQLLKWEADGITVHIA